MLAVGRNFSSVLLGAHKLLNQMHDSDLNPTIILVKIRVKYVILINFILDTTFFNTRIKNVHYRNPKTKDLKKKRN